MDGGSLNGIGDRRSVLSCLLGVVAQFDVGLDESASSSKDESAILS